MQSPDPVPAPWPAEVAPSAPPADSPRPRRRARPRLPDLLCAAALVAVLVIAGWLRFTAQNWDDYAHLHPDERFLTDVVSQLNGALRFTDRSQAEQDAHAARCLARYPATGGAGGYFDADCSPLNPNNLGKGSYVYGEFPLFTVRAAGEARSRLSQEWQAVLDAFDAEAAATHRITTHWTGYSGAQLIGRGVSSIADWLTVLVVFLLGRRLYGRWVGVLAAGLYGVAGFPVQQAQFWTVDAFTTFWVALALYLAVRALDGASIRQAPLALVYTLAWAVAVGWQAAAQRLPMLGLLALGAAALVVYGLIAAGRALAGSRGRGGDLLLAATPVIASLLTLAGWSAADSLAERPFALADDLIALGVAGLFFGLVVWIDYLAAAVLRRRRLGLAVRQDRVLIGALALAWLVATAALLLAGFATGAAIFLIAAGVALIVFDATDLTDYALFGVALGAAVASRINIAPLAGIIVLAAILRALPALDGALGRAQRNRLLAHAMIGVAAAALLSFVVFRLLQPHAFLGPGLFGLRFNPGWRQDMADAAYFTSGDWDAPPNHQWASRTPYFFPWRHIVLWGLGLPLGLVAWGAWAWAGLAIVRGRPLWTRHAIPFLWILVLFGWLGGRWVTTMRYFLPLYPPLALLGAWGLISLLRGAWPRARTPLPGGAWRRLAQITAALLLVIVVVYTALYGVGIHTMHSQQLTRVAASRWFQENVPGDFGIWIERADGTREMVNLGRGAVAPPPTVSQLTDGQSADLALAPTGDASLTRVILNRVRDPLNDPAEEAVRVQVFANDAALGMQLLFEDVIRADFNASASPYGAAYGVTPDEPIPLPASGASVIGAAPYVVRLTALDGPVTLVRDVADEAGGVLSNVSVGLTMAADGVQTFVDLNLPAETLITGHGDDIPAPPTTWPPGESVPIQFSIPVDGVIREIEIPHLGDPLNDADAEEVRFTLTGPDRAQTSATLRADLSAAAGLGGPQTITFDPPLVVQRDDAAGSPQLATLTVEARDPVYTSGPVIAWEGDWDDPVPWPVCPLPGDVVYRDDLPSGLSSYDCAALNMYNGHYQGLKLWMVAEDNAEKRTAMLNALDQADYLVITSNRFYDSLTRVPMRWPMTGAYYDALFGGELGFELVREFESPPRLGPFWLRDQVIPSDDLPGWVNEHWESEEAFSVYDHPIVLVYRKTADYTPERAAAVLDSVSIRPAHTAIPGYADDPEPIGVVGWGAKQASAAPTLLEFDAAKQAIQTDGGTWSKLFDPDWLVNRSQVAAVIFWWLLMIAAGWIAWPLLFALLPALPDRAYPAAKITAWLIIAWAAWAGGTLNLRTWTRPGLLLILLGLAALSVLVGGRRRGELARYVRANWRHLLALELLTLALFGAFLGVRLGNPDLWHGSFGGEKPMDFAYFNGVLRSTVFPPLDPWFAGGFINYYYFGYVIVGAPVKLLGIAPSVAYNLIIPTLFALTGVGVFSVAYNWVRARAMTPGTVEGATRDAREVEVEVVVASTSRDWSERAPDAPRPAAPVIQEPRAPRGSAWLAGLLALLLAVVMGNLGTFYVILDGVAYVGGWERPPLFETARHQQAEAQRTAWFAYNYEDAAADFTAGHGFAPTSPNELSEVTLAAQQATDAQVKRYAEHPPIYRLWEYELGNLRRQVSAFAEGLPKVLDGAPLQQAPGIPLASHRWHWGPTRIISELPDGAGHNAIAEMPYFTFLYGDLHAHMLAFPLTLLVLLWLLAEISGAGWALRTGWESALALGLGALAVGVLRPTNSWDWITYLLLGAAGLTFAAWVGASRTRGLRPESGAADRLWAWLRPGRARDLLLVLAVVPFALAARIGFYLLMQLMADQQAERGLRPGETLIQPSLTLGSALAWAAAGVALVGVLYVALLIMLRVRIDKPILLGWLGRVAAFVALTFATGLPFTAYFATAYSSVKPWENETTPLWAYLYVHGTFIFIVISFLVWQSARWLRRVRVRALQGLVVPVLVGGGALLLIVLGGIVFGVRQAAVAELVIPLVAWAGLLFLLPDQSPLLRAVYAIIALALSISLGVDLVVLDGDIGRQNTVFKFYLQVWLLLSVVGGVVLAWMLPRVGRWRLGLRLGWQAALAALFAVALLYPVLATQARFLDRFARDETPLTLDGMEYMKYAVHGESGLWFPLRGDYDMIRWLQANVEGSPVVMEAHLFPSEYHWGGRISIYTGLPTVLGWRWHQLQQRSLPEMDKLVQTRENNVAAFYELPGADGIRAARGLIAAYDVQYIVVGALERAFYEDIQPDPATSLPTAGHSEGLAKFETMADAGLLERVYSAPHCLDTAVEDVALCAPAQVYEDVIYRVLPGAALPEGEVAAR